MLTLDRAAVGLLTVNNLSPASQTATLMALTMALASLVMSVTFVWRYQRQLSNIHDLRKIMVSAHAQHIKKFDHIRTQDEFIYEADSDIMPIFLSLPVSFLLWSAIAFGTAVLTHAWHTLSSTGPAIPVGVTTTLGLTGGIGTIVWISHRRIDRLKEWLRLGLWAAPVAVGEQEVGLTAL